MYVHCHNRTCRWEQDDFWSRHYNPAKTLWEEICWLARPHMVRTETRVFSWLHLARCFYWRVTAPFKQKWWTHDSWKKAIKANGGKWPPCPKCGEHQLDTD